MGDSYRRRVIFLGQSGAGKSTALNSVYNADVSRRGLESPARVGMTAKGVTSEMNNYITQSNTFLTDTIGFDDNRFDPLILAHEMRRVLRASQVGFTHIVLVMPLGRITAATRVYLAMLETIFGESYVTNLAMFISKCDDGTTAEDFMKVNSEDEDLAPLCKSLLSLPGDSPRVIAGSFMNHRNTDRDKVYYPDRLQTLRNIEKFLDTNLDCLSPPAGNSLEMIKDFLELVMRKVFMVTDTLGSVLGNMMTEHITIRNHFPECSVCLEGGYAEGNKAMQLSCNHIFHAGCLLRVSDLQVGCMSATIECPNCRAQAKYPGELLPLGFTASCAPPLEQNTCTVAEDA